MKRTVKDVAEFVGARVVGNGSVELEHVARVSTGNEAGAAHLGSLVFVEDVRHLRSALESPASAVICGPFGEQVACEKPLLISAEPRLAFARAAALLGEKPSRVAQVHPSAVVDPSAVLGKNVSIDAMAVVGANAEISDGSWIGAGAVISRGVKIGKACEIYPRVCIYSSVRIGNRVIVHAGAVLGSDGFGYVRERATGRYEKFPQVGSLEIGDDVEIGANTAIDRGALDVTRIGRGAKIDNLVHIGHNCQIGEDVVIAAQTGLSGSITIERGAVLGGQVGIGEHAHIGEGVLLGGQGGVLPHKVLRGKGVAFWGTPAKPLREYLKELASLRRMSKRND